MSQKYPTVTTSAKEFCKRVFIERKMAFDIIVRQVPWNGKNNFKKKSLVIFKNNSPSKWGLWWLKLGQCIFDKVHKPSISLVQAPGLDYRGNKCTAVVPHGTGTTAGTYRGTVLKKVPVTLPKARKLANRYRYLDIQSGSLVYGIGGYCYCLDEFIQIVIIFLHVFLHI